MRSHIQPAGLLHRWRQHNDEHQIGGGGLCLPRRSQSSLDGRGQELLQRLCF